MTANLPRVGDIFAADVTIEKMEYFPGGSGEVLAYSTKTKDGLTVTFMTNAKGIYKVGVGNSFKLEGEINGVGYDGFGENCVAKNIGLIRPKLKK